MSKSGSCLCGEVEVHASQVEEGVGACHCSMCRKWSGGPFYAAHCGTSVTFKGEDAITRFASSAWGERGFCHRCGTHLFFQHVESGAYFIPAGIFNDNSLKLESEIFTDEKGSYYALDADSIKMTGAEFIASMEKGE
ncbi:GFA family protein [Alteromonas confluentis]|uniref:Aldehyde-activating protein n=1 Tax=Alteromonas confluentis TaxID=1656094 RepID=A0A1E7ZDE8_9ALTE|nr:GFA family protein [Alteromonas confluentis]OFC71520.1 aldehyde-activating protein [Alteromonas confluentis]